MDKKRKNLIEIISAISDLTIGSSLMAIGGNGKGIIKASGDPDEIVSVLRGGMARDPRIADMINKAAKVEQGDYITAIQNAVGRTEALFLVAVGKHGTITTIEGKLGKTVAALKLAAHENPDINTLLEIAVKCDGDCDNCKVYHENLSSDISIC